MSTNKGQHNINLKIQLSISLIVLNIICVETNHKKAPGLVYVLMWTDRGRDPFRFWSRKRESLVLMNCEYQNCYLTDNREFFLDPTDFDVILFNAVNIDSRMDLPSARSDNQLYIFVSTESEANYRISDDFNYFFNYTWSYKLNSDIFYPYFVVRNKRGEVVAPKTRVRWMNPKYMKPPKVSVIEKLQNKSIGAAWFVSHCVTNSLRIEYIRILRLAFDKLGHQIDVFGGCDANKVCGRDKMDDCLALVEANYYFYLSFENSFSEDYVTEKVMTAIDHYAVPVVYGAADYSRFLPDGTYLNAKEYTALEMANKMNEIIQDKQKYYDFFKFHRYYTYHAVAESVDTDPLCAFCAFINDESRRNERRTYGQFTNWWHKSDLKKNETDNMIVRYESSGPHIKGIITYRYKNTETREFATPSTLESVGDFVNNILDYYFPSK